VSAAAFTLFVSDLHLSPAQPVLTDRFVRFCRDSARPASALYVLGDLFDFWVGDDTLEEPLHREVCGALKSVADAGVAVRFMAGNRDFLVGADFAAAAGATLIEDPTIVNLHGTPTLLMHGDSLCTDDHAYMAFRAQVRNPKVQAQFLSLPVAARWQQVGATRDASEREKQVKTMDIMDVAPAAVEDILRASGYPRLIHGHTHRPARHEHVVDGHRCERWVIADWRADLAEALRVDARGVTRLPLAL
jgi:UDP-2,3-diacylglucosamine hydrolase